MSSKLQTCTVFKVFPDGRAYVRIDGTKRDTRLADNHTDLAVGYRLCVKQTKVGLVRVGWISHLTKKR